MKKEHIAIKADPSDPEDFDVTEEALAEAQAARRGRGRPAGSDKEQVTLRIDRDVLDAFKVGGAGWQTRINDALRKAAAQERA